MTFARQPRPAAFLSLLFTLVLHFLLDGALARPAILANDGTLVPVPNEDPFYTPPAGFEDLPPGSIIRSRPLPGHITLDNATPLHPEAAWQILYRSQDSVGVPEATVVTIIKPYNADPTKLMAFGFFSVSGLRLWRGGEREARAVILRILGLILMVGIGSGV